MTREELKDELEAIRYPLYQQRSSVAMQRISYLYTKITQRELRGGCYACHLDAFEELKGILTTGRAWDKSVTLAIEFLNPQTKIIMSKLEKYEFKKKTAVISLNGAGDFLTINNATDEKIEALRKSHPSTFEKFFKVRDGVVIDESEKPKKLTAKKQAKLDAEKAEEEAKLKAESEANETESFNLDELDMEGLKVFIVDNELNVEVSENETEDSLREKIASALESQEEAQ